MMIFSHGSASKAAFPIDFVACFLTVAQIP